MKRALLLLLIALATSAQAAPFTAGDIVVERVGDGVLSLSSSATIVNLLEYTSAGSLVQTIPLQAVNPAPTSAPFNATESGITTVDGYLNLSTDGKVLTIPGYNASPGVGTVATSSTSTVSRTISLISSSGNPDTSTSVAMMSSNNFRSVISDNGTRFWASGGSGISYVNAVGATGASGVTSLYGGNARNIEIYNGSLYAATASSSFTGSNSQFGIYRIGSGLPTTAVSSTNVSLLLSTGSGSSPVGFLLFDKNNDSTLDTAFIADEDVSAGGGILRYDFDGTNWTQKYNLNPSSNTVGGIGSLLSGATGLGLRGLAGRYDGQSDTFSLFATTAAGTANNSLIRFTDLGNDSGTYTVPVSYNVIAMSGSNTVFRGVDFAPTAAVPEPDTWMTLGVGMLVIWMSYGGKNRRLARASSI
jgi:hypothetical protein